MNTKGSRKDLNNDEVIIHIPHSSTVIPPQYRAGILLSDAELKQELLRMTDHFVNDLFNIPAAHCHLNFVSRLVMDPERFRSDGQESMAEKGMGVVYTQTSAGLPLRRTNQRLREKIVGKLYDPYHAKLTRRVDTILETHQHCLIIDAHSFSSAALPYEQRSATENPEDRPDICLGYDPFHISLNLLRRSTDYFAGNGLTVAHNDPFAGSLVPIKHYHQDGRVQSLMVEINRKLYLDEQSGEKNDNYEPMHKLIIGFFEMLKSIN